MESRFRQRQLLIWILFALSALAIAGFAMRDSVSIRTSWRVLPYQSLRLTDSNEDISELVLALPEATPLDVARGYIESEHAVRLHIVSNSAWKLQVLVYELASAWTSRMQLRNHGGEYIVLSEEPRIVAEGQNGVFEISIDYRLLADQYGGFPLEPAPEVVFMMVSD